MKITGGKTGKKVGVIGCGLIGEPVVRALVTGQAGNWVPEAILTRQPKTIDGLQTETDPDRFFDRQFDLIIDAAGPGSLRQYGERSLALADLWTIGAVALASPEFCALLKKCAFDHSHRLRILPGAIGGLDAIRTLSQDENVMIKVSVDLAQGLEARPAIFSGGLEEGARQFPDHVNVAVAVGLASGRPENVQLEVNQPGPGETRKLAISASSKFGQVDLEMIPTVVPSEGVHTVAASLLAALRCDQDVIWAG